MKKLLFILITLLCFSNLFAFTIVENGNAKAKIVIKKNANVTEKYAAEEFAKYVEKSTGVKLEITDTPSKAGNIYISTKENAPDNNDQVNISCDGKNLYLRGNNNRGTLYSVYEFLEVYEGVKFFTQDCEKVPTFDVYECPDSIKYTYKSPLMIRDTDHVQSAWCDYSPKFRINGAQAGNDPKLGGRIDFDLYFCHSFQQVMPVDKYGIEHPDFYANGQIDKNNQLCMTNPEMRKEYVKNVLNDIKAKNITKGMIDVSQNDNRIKCECDRCKAAEKKYGAYSGVLIEFVNYVAAEVEKVYPDIMVETLAYQITKEAPSNIKVRDNVYVRLCSIECNFSEPFEYKDKNAPYTVVKGSVSNTVDKDSMNKRFDENITKWAKLTKNLYIWDYVVNFNNYHIIHPNFQVLKSNINYLIDHNAVAIFEEADRHNYGASFDELRNYMYCKLMWDPTLDDKALMEDFCQNVYGKGAEDILEILKTCTDLIVNGHYYMNPYPSDNNTWLDDDNMIKCIKLFQSALEKTKDTPYEYDKINTAYTSFLVGWYLKPDESFEKIKAECGLNWTKEEFYSYLHKYSIDHKNPNYREHAMFDQSKNATKFKKVGPTPEMCQGLSDDEWLEINDGDINILQEFGAISKIDNTLAKGISCYFKPNGEWNTYLPFGGNTAYYKSLGYKTFDMYVVAKAVGKKDDVGDGLSFGIHDFGADKQVYYKTIPLSEFNEEWQTYHLGEFDISEVIDPGLFYVAGSKTGEPHVDYIAYDKMIIILKK